ncbi:hypothetical protein FDP22_07790 [Paroceanicella profunda]|uniref:DUF3035 domain-containing protein n=1 Tax=Paroceanicella profunda TaxID=2579971 RepID=A0A5B8FW74_9RHOB|nr:hypothetical protein [Paroceanicella profunda]QDL91694.1 hypothetical protein FDP22_07790 [Paroceanicella profunda]
MKFEVTTPRTAGAFCRMAAACVLLAGCGTLGPELGDYDLVESDTVRDAPWPRLVDIPEPPAAGTFTAQVPDPAQGQALITDLSAEAQAMRARAEALSAPVLSPADLARLGKGR